MIVRKVDEIASEAIIEKGVKGVSKQVLLGPEQDVPNFIMRRFRVAPGGYTFYHAHDFEHEVYVLSGSGVVRQENSEVSIGPDTAVLVAPNEIHQFINTGDEPLVFLCIIPR